MLQRYFQTFLLLLLAAAGAAAQDPDIEADERAAIEEYFRTSEQPGETPVNARQRGQKRVSVPPGAVRIGCVCMDDTPSEARSIGACSGHGGVRYWLYRSREGDTLRILTARHQRHPHPLDSLERSALAPPRTQRRQPTLGPALPPTIVVVQPLLSEPRPIDDDMDWPEAAGLTAGSAMLLWSVRLLLGWADKQTPLLRDALHYLLRHRKRPPARKNRQNPDPPRL